MDPASPGFEGHAKEVQLSAKDCWFVDVLHTNGEPIFPTFGLGYMTPIGEIIFSFYLICTIKIPN